MRIVGDKKARVPFAVVGIVLIVGSTVTSTFIISIENEVSKSTYEPLKKEEIDSMLSLMQTDLAIALNYAAMKAMDYVGKNPVIKPNLNSSAANTYNEGGDIMKFNRNWVRNITRVYFNKYIIANYMYNAFNNGKYAINVIGNGNDFLKGPIKNLKNITIEEIKGSLDRSKTNPPSLDESARSFISKSIGEVPIYWKFDVILPVEIIDMEKNEVIEKREIEISTIATSRLPLLMYLTHIYEESLKGSAGTGNIFALITLLSELFTEGRALAQYGGMKSEIPNIVDNRWLKYITNLALLIEEFAVFNSIDPIAAVHLIFHCQDLLAKGFPEEKEIREIYKEGSNLIGNLFDMKDSILKSISNDEKKQSIAEEKINKPKPKPKRYINITRIAENLLYDTNYSYYYANKSNGKWEMLSPPSEEFKGYYYEKNGKRWKYIPAPPYIYKNLSTSETIVLEKYNGEWIYRNGKKYYLDENNSGYRRNVNRQQLNKKVNENLSKILDEVYYVEYKITGEPEKIKIYWEKEPPDGTGWTENGATEWKKIDDIPVTKIVNKGDVIHQFPYVEKWKVKWEREHTYTKTIHEGNRTITLSETAIERKEVTIKIGVNANYPLDVKNIFNKTMVNLQKNRIDYNLFNSSKDFVEYFVGKREEIFDKIKKENDRYYESHSSKEIFEEIKKDEKYQFNPYAMKWLSGIEGEVAEALKEIFGEIKRDNITAVPEENYKEKDYDETINQHISQLKQKFAEKLEKYISDSKYRDGDRYISCGAKVVARMRKWYVETIWNILNNSASKLKNNLEQNVKDALSKEGYSSDLLNKRNEIKSSAEKMGFDLSSLSLQFGLSMPININGNIEQIGFSVNQKPKYFDYEGLSENDLYRFKVKNICLFGPTGLPILPTPITPWIITINTWYVEIEGSFSKFEISDTVGEMIPNILFGNIGTSYVRYKNDVIDPVSQTMIGSSDPLAFSIETINVAVTPPGFVGDINPTSYPSEENGVGLGGEKK